MPARVRRFTAPSVAAPFCSAGLFVEELAVKAGRLQVGRERRLGLTSLGLEDACPGVGLGQRCPQGHT